MNNEPHPTTAPGPFRVPATLAGRLRLLALADRMGDARLCRLFAWEGGAALDVATLAAWRREEVASGAPPYTNARPRRVTGPRGTAVIVSPFPAGVIEGAIRMCRSSPRGYCLGRRAAARRFGVCEAAVGLWWQSYCKQTATRDLTRAA